MSWLGPPGARTSKCELGEEGGAAVCPLSPGLLACSAGVGALVAHPSFEAVLCPQPPGWRLGS